MTEIVFIDSEIKYITTQNDVIGTNIFGPTEAREDASQRLSFNRIFFRADRTSKPLGRMSAISAAMLKVICSRSEIRRSPVDFVLLALHTWIAILLLGRLEGVER